MLRRLLGKGAAISSYAVRSKPPTATIFFSLSRGRSGGGGGYERHLSTALPRSVSSSSSDSPLLTALFQSYGIREEDTNVILGKCPRFRGYDVENILRPKLEFLRSVGFTGADISRIVVANPIILSYNLENSISASIKFLSTILPSKDALIRVLKWSAHLTRMEPNIEVLRHRGVPETWILNMLHSHPRALARRPEHFLATVEHVEDLGLSPHNGGSYVRALGVMSYMSRLAFLRKVEMYKQLGWSEDQVLKLIRTQPKVLAMSEDNVRRKMEFFEKRVGWGTDYLSLDPALLMYSLDKRIIPRCAVLNVLLSRGLVSTGAVSSRSFVVSNKRFFDSYVSRYEEEIPDVARAFRGHVDFQGWERNNNIDEEKEKPSKTRKV